MFQIHRLIYIIIFFLLHTGFSNAQSEEAINRYLNIRQKEYHQNDNRGYWSFSLSGGAVTYCAEMDQTFDRDASRWLSPYGKLTVAGWFNQVVGIRWQYDGGRLQNEYVRQEDPDTDGRLYFMDSYLQVITNVMNWGIVKRSQRPVSILLYGGAGVAWTPKRKLAPVQWSPAALIGAQLNIRITNYWSVALELDGTIVKDNFNSRVGGRRYEGYAGVSAGLVYRLW